MDRIYNIRVFCNHSKKTEKIFIVSVGKFVMENELYSQYSARKHELKERLLHFRQVWQNSANTELFSELCFCLLTPQSGAFACDAAIKRCVEDNTLFHGTEKQLQEKIHPIRFYRNKSKYIFGARNFFSENENIAIRKVLLDNGILSSPFQAREWLVKNVKGLGYKEASHFLRNIGFGENICILDRHILKNLKKHNVIKKFPKTLTRKNYLSLEKKMLKFSEKTGIPAAELDLLFWSMETGKVFK